MQGEGAVLLTRRQDLLLRQDHIRPRDHLIQDLIPHLDRLIQVWEGQIRFQANPRDLKACFRK